MFFCGGFFSSSVCLLVSKCLKKRLSESQTPRPRKPFLHGKSCLQAWLRFWVHWYMFSSDSGGSLGALSCEPRESLPIRWYTRTTSTPDRDAPRRSRGQPTVALPRIDGIGHTCFGTSSGLLREFDSRATTRTNVVCSGSSVRAAGLALSLSCGLADRRMYFFVVPRRSGIEEDDQRGLSAPIQRVTVIYSLHNHAYTKDECRVQWIQCATSWSCAFSVLWVGRPSHVPLRCPAP